MTNKIISSEIPEPDSFQRNTRTNVPKNKTNKPKRNVLNADGDGRTILNFFGIFLLLGFSRNFLYSSVGF